MRVYLIADGHLIQEISLRCSTEDEGIAEARLILEGSSSLHDGFELWDGNKFIHREGRLTTVPH